MTNSDVCVLIPTLDEAETIGPVIDGFAEEGFENVLVVDGGSTDGTRTIARDHGARVVQQSGSGKGQAVREAFRYVEVPYVLMLDGDMTYDPADAPKMLEPLFEGRAEHVIGDRFADMHDEAMPRLNQVGNRIINSAFAAIHGRNLGDILSGYRAFTVDSIRRIELESDGFTIETEFAVECVKHGVQTAVVPVSYHPRPDDSDTNLHPIKDGGRIVLALYSLAKTNNPLFYFGSVGTASVFAGTLLGAWVGYEWWVVGISHQVYAVVAGVAILLGAQLLMFAVLSDMLVAVNREQTNRLEALADRMGEARASQRRPGPLTQDAIRERTDRENREERELRAED